MIHDPDYRPSKSEIAYWRDKIAEYDKTKEKDRNEKIALLMNKFINLMPSSIVIRDNGLLYTLATAIVVAEESKNELL